MRMSPDCAFSRADSTRWATPRGFTCMMSVMASIMVMLFVRV